MNSKGRSTVKYSSKFFQLVVWLLIWTFLLPAPMSGLAAPSDAQPWNRHVHERWNSPERARAIEEAARIDAEARAQFERSEATAQQPTAASAPTAKAPAPDVTTVAQDTSRSVEPFRPKSVTEVLFNYAAGFAGVPGLAPQRDINGNFDEGLGFHQDGTVRRAGGTASASGPSDRGQRARSYMQSGFQNGYGMNGFGAGYGGLYDEMHYDLWGRNDPTRGGRIGAGNSYSRDLGDFDPVGMALDRGLNYGAGLLNSAGEAAISGLVDGGRARLNFYLDKDGYFGGEGDALLPWYDSQYTTVFTQLGARSMHDESDTRWIGNFGLGQRWFPAATEEDSGNWMVGYNAFFDYDFTRDHQRGGVGVEAQYDWLRLASNYYFPLSSWKGSEDFDSDFVKERPAKGWDMRVKGYMPFYRNLAITGAYSQWYGDHVGMFGASNLEKDPKVWSYGLEYTPIPLVSGFITQKSTERGRTDTEFGLNFTYHFQMPWEDQISHAKVAELRTVSGSRHEFVDRENRIILEYKAKNNYYIEFVSRSGNVFTFRLKHPLHGIAAGKTVRVSASGVTTLAEYKAAPTESGGFFAQAGEFLGNLFSVSTAHAADLFQTYVTDRNGEFRVTMTGFLATSTVTIQAGEAVRTFTAAELGGGVAGYDITYVSGHQATLPQGNSMTMVYTVTMQGTSDPAPDGTAVTLLAQTQGGSGAQKLEVASGSVSGGSGQVSLTFTGGSGSTLDNNAFLARKVVLYGKVGGSESSASGVVTVGTIPSGSGGSYLTGVSGSNMTWSTAKNYCESHGGTLPLVNPPNTSQSTGQVWGGTATVSGTGSVDTSGWSTPWGNTGLPGSDYWTGTEVPDSPGRSWFVDDYGGSVNVTYVARRFYFGVVCVP